MSSLSYNNPTRLIKNAFGIVLIGSAILRFFMDVFAATVKLFWTIIFNIPWIAIIGTLWLSSALFFSYGNGTLEEIEYLWRCWITPIYTDFFKPIFGGIVDVYDATICWWNMVGLVQRYANTRLIWDTLSRCENGFRFWNMLAEAFDIMVEGLKIVVIWFFVNNPLQYQLPAQPWIARVFAFSVTIGNMFRCLCEDLRILILFLERILISNYLSCLLNQILNAVIEVGQLLTKLVVDVVLIFIDIVLVHVGDVDYFKSLVSGEIPGFNLPYIITAVERLAAAAYQFGQLLNDVVQIIICTVVSEIEAEGDVLIVDQKYATCVSDPLTRIDLFCLTGPLAAIVLRTIESGVALLLNVFRVLYEFVSLPPGNRYVTDNWSIDRIFDTLRAPPPLYDFSASVNFPTFVPGSNQSSITIQNAYAYGPETDPTDVGCQSQLTDRNIIFCDSCPDIAQQDVEECICNFSRDMDRLILDLLDFKIFDGFLCCVVGRVIRVITAVLKFVKGFLVHMFVLDRFTGFITDYNNWNTVFDELIGPYDQLGGLLGCCARILNGFDARLECICGLLTNLIKPAFEAIRVIGLCIVGMLNDVFDGPGLGFFDLACTTKTTCLDLEERIFKYLRTTRPNPGAGMDPNYLDTYFPVSVSAVDSWIDCVCAILSFRFLNQFLEEPVENVPDFCCPVRYAFRIVVELSKGITGIVFTLFETIESMFFTDVSVKLTFLGYLACASEQSCAPVAQILSDVKDFLGCECTIVNSFDAIVEPLRINFPCVCLFTNSIALIFYHSLKSFTLAAQTLAELIDCVTLGFPVGSYCGKPSPGCIGGDIVCNHMKSRIVLMFDELHATIDSGADLFSTAGCVLGHLFNVNCIGNRYHSPSDFDTCVGGDTHGTCGVSDRLTRVFKMTFLVLASIINFLIDMVKDFSLVAFGVTFGGSTYLSDLLYDAVIAIGSSIFGIQEPPGGAAPTTGLIQALCYLINCAAGPSTFSCINTAAPLVGSSDTGSTTICVADFMCVFGDELRRFLPRVAFIVSSAIGVVESLLGGNWHGLAAKLGAFVTGIIQLVMDIFKNADNFFRAIEAVLLAIVQTIFRSDGFTKFIKFFLDTARTIADGFIKFIAFFTGGDPDGDTSGKKRWNSGFFYESAKSKHESKVNDDDEMHAFYIKHFKNNQQQQQQQDVKRTTFDGDIDGSIFDFAESTKGMAENMKQNAYCKRVMEQLSSKKSFEELHFTEEAIWKICFVAYATPLWLNDVYEGESFKRSTLENTKGPSLGFKLPENVFYDPIAFTEAFSDVAGLMTEYANWRTGFSLFSTKPKDVVTIESMPSWFWEYQKDAYTRSANTTTEDQASSSETFRYEPKRSENPDHYIYHPDEVWEHASPDIVFINLPGDQMSVPVINGRYPVVQQNVTFVEHLKLSGYTSDLVMGISDHLIFQEKVDFENTALTMFGHLDAMERNIRGSAHVNSTDEFGNYNEEYINGTISVERPLIDRYRPQTSTTSIWEHLFQMNSKTASIRAKERHEQKTKEYEERKKRFSSTFAPNDDEEQEKTADVAIDFILNLFENTIVPLKNHFIEWSDPVDSGWVKTDKQKRAYETLRHFTFKRASNDNDKTKTNKEKEEEELLFFESKSIFDHLRSYVFETIPATIETAYNRLTGRIDFDELFLEAWFDKTYATAENGLQGFTLRHVNEMTILHPKRYSFFSANELNDVLTLQAVKNEFERAHPKKRTSDLEAMTPTPRLRYPFPKNGNTKRRLNVEKTIDDMNMDPKSFVTVHQRYGHVLGNKSLIGHRFEMMKNATQAIVRKFRTETLSLSKASINFRYKYFDRLAKIYSDTIRKRNKTPTLLPFFSLMERLANIIYRPLRRGDGETDELGESNKRNVNTEGGGSYSSSWNYASFKRFLTFGDPSYDDVPFVSGAHLEEGNKRVLYGNPYMLPGCIKGDFINTCVTCSKCPTDRCSNCKTCRNCTDVGGGNIVCERCSICSIGGPNCARGCTGCQTCSPIQACKDCIATELASYIVDSYEFCLNPYVRSLPPNATIIELPLRNTSKTYGDPVSEFLFNTVLPWITEYDIGGIVEKFFSNRESDVFEPPIGAYYFFTTNVLECNRDANTQCALGTGLKRGIVISLITTLVLAFLLWFIFPPLAGVVGTVVGAVGWVIFFILLTAAVSWFYMPFCLFPTFPLFFVVPFPTCMMREIYELIDVIASPCNEFLQSDFFSKLVKEGTDTCPTCPSKLSFRDDLWNNFQSQFDIPGYLLQRYLPDAAHYLQSTSLVKGGGIWGLTGILGPYLGLSLGALFGLVLGMNSGLGAQIGLALGFGLYLSLGLGWAPLAPLFSTDFNITTFSNGTVSDQTAAMDVLSQFLSGIPLITLIGFLYVIFLLLPFVLECLDAVVRLLQNLLVIPPLSYLMVWPFNYILRINVRDNSAYYDLYEPKKTPRFDNDDYDGSEEDEYNYPSESSTYAQSRSNKSKTSVDKKITSDYDMYDSGDDDDNDDDDDDDYRIFENRRRRLMRATNNKRKGLSHYVQHWIITPISSLFYHDDTYYHLTYEKTLGDRFNDRKYKKS